MKLSPNYKSITVFQLAMLITVSIDSIRNLPATAMFGSVLPFFFLMAVIFFLLPTGLISAELSASQKNNNGIYGWVKAAMGERFGVLAIWLQWINTMVWYPTILSFIAGALAFLIDPHLASEKSYIISVILVVFWTLTIVNLRGIQTSTRFASLCGVIGMLLPMGLLIVFAIIWFASKQPLHIHFTAHNFYPNLRHPQSWISFTAIITSLVGMELATVHVQKIKHADNMFPKAILISTCIIFITIILGSLSIAFIIPSKHINLVEGVMQAFSYYMHYYHIGFLLPIIAILVLIGITGGMINWMISPAEGLLQAAQDRYLPKFFSHQNKHGVANRVLISQAILVSLLCLVIYILPNVNAAYWLLTDLSTELYLCMYMLMFIAALILKYKSTKPEKNLIVPMGKKGIYLLCILGMIGSLVALVIGFIPPTNLNIGDPSRYEFIFIAGIILMLAPSALLYLTAYLNKKRKTQTK